MTDYIDEMMETAACEEKRCPNNVYDELCKKYEFCNNAPHCKIYPDFTAEKQLEVIKLILCSDDIDELNQYYSEILKAFVFECYSIPELGMRASWRTQNKDYDLALAELITILMDAGELDKKKVKEVLEDAR